MITQPWELAQLNEKNTDLTNVEQDTQENIALTTSNNSSCQSINRITILGKADIYLSGAQGRCLGSWKCLILDLRTVILVLQGCEIATCDTFSKACKTFEVLDVRCLKVAGERGRMLSRRWHLRPHIFSPYSCDRH